MYLPADKARIIGQFDYYVKTCLKHELYDAQEQEINIAKHEVNFSALSPERLEQIPAEEQGVPLYGEQILVDYPNIVKNERLLAAIDLLTQRKREIILLHYFQNYTDAQIGRRDHSTEDCIRKMRNRILKDLRRMMEEEH